MHRERADSLLEGNKIAINRYKFAIDCLKNKSRNIIDFGCGLGYGCYMLRQAGHIVVGVDNSNEAINYCQDNYPGCYYVADIEKIEEFRNIETVVCFEVLCHLNNPKEFVKKINANKLVNELIVSAPINPNPNDGYKWRLHNFSEEEFKNLFKNKWEIKKEMKQKGYLTLYLRKL